MWKCCIWIILTGLTFLFLSLLLCLIHESHRVLQLFKKFDQLSCIYDFPHRGLLTWLVTHTPERVLLLASLFLFLVLLFCFVLLSLLSNEDKWLFSYPWTVGSHMDWHTDWYPWYPKLVQRQSHQLPNQKQNVAAIKDCSSALFLVVTVAHINLSNF